MFGHKKTPSNWNVQLLGVTSYRAHIFLLSCVLLFTASAAAEPVTFQDVLERSTVTPDSIVRYGGAEPQFIELYLPATMAESASSSPPPLVAFLHGGCWLNSFNVEHARGLAEGIRNAGYAVALVEYRRLDDEGGGWPGTIDDIESALTALSASNSDDYNSEHITLIGHSAGGHLALLASQPERGFPIQGVIGLAAITDITAYAAGDSGCEQAAARFIATAPSEEVAMNPVQQDLHANIVLLRGTEDTIVAAEQMQLEQAGAIHIEGAGHFDVIHPGTSAFRLLLGTLERMHLSQGEE